MKRGWHVLALFALVGCGRTQPGTLDVPPEIRARPGVFADLNPRWSHDGRRIAFLRATSDRSLQLHVADEDLSRPLALLESELVSPDRPYSSSLNRYSSPDTLAWSPDDHEIAFARIEWFTFEDGERLPGTGLWALDTYSGRVTPLALHPARYTSGFYYFHAPAWSPDGRYLAFIGEGINGQRALFIRSLRAQKAQEVTPRFDNYEDSDWPCWEPDAPAALIYRQGRQRAHWTKSVETLRRIQPGSVRAMDTGELWRITTADYRKRTNAPAPDGITIKLRAGHPAWSLEGRQLAFTLTPDANDLTRSELWVVGKKGEGAERVSPADGRGYFAPIWIGSSRLGAFSPHGDRFDVVTIDLQTHQTRVLGTIDSADADWSPDRSRIVYAGRPIPDRVPSDMPTTLRLLETGLRVAVPGQENAP